MGADILDGLERFANGGYGDWSTVASKAIARIQLDAAEIGRLRGEVKDLEMAWCGEPLDPAPAMPNGVEVPPGWKIEADGEALRVTRPDGVLSAWLHRPTTNGSGMYDLCMDLLRAADNRDAAGVVVTREMWEAGTSAYAEWVRQVYSRGMPTPEDRAEGRDIAIAAMHAAAPAAVPAGEAVAKADDFRGWYCAQGQRGVDGREVTFGEQHEVCGRYITDDRPPTPQPADGEAVALAVARVQRGPAPHDALYAMLLPEGPMTPKVKEGDPLYLRPPAQVQAAPKEGECASCETEGVFATDGSGPFDCYACGKKAAHPSACELVVDDAMVERGCRAVAAAGPGEERHYLVDRNVVRAALTAALQHRGDSQEVGRG